MRDFSIHTDHVIEARRPDLVVVDKKRSCKIIDFAVPGHSRIEEKEKDKIVHAMKKSKKYHCRVHHCLIIVPMSHYKVLSGYHTGRFLSSL